MKEPLWLSVARMSEGISEIPGAASNPVILRWAADVHAPAYDNDDIAWCAVWLNRVLLACQLPLSGMGYELLRAKSFAAWGLPLQAPALGCVMVFSRTGGHHVGFYLGERANDYRVLGGNTGNSVAPTWIAKSKLIAMRWPNNVPSAVPKVIVLADDGYPATEDQA